MRGFITVICIFYTLALCLALSPVTIRVCQGSGCLGKCRGSFNPKETIERETRGQDAVVQEAFCLNQCKRGPNLRILTENEDKQKAVVFERMTETEQSRKTFQSVSSDERVLSILDTVSEFQAGRLEGKLMDASKLGDILPRDTSE